MSKILQTSRLIDERWHPAKLPRFKFKFGGSLKLVCKHITCSFVVRRTLSLNTYDRTPRHLQLAIQTPQSQVNMFRGDLAAPHSTGKASLPQAPDSKNARRARTTVHQQFPDLTMAHRITKKQKYQDSQKIKMMR